jgi:hypothetical protein
MDQRSITAVVLSLSAERCTCLKVLFFWHTLPHSFIDPSLICLPMPRYDPTRHCEVRVTGFMEKVPSQHQFHSGMRRIISNAKPYHRCLWMIQMSRIPTPLEIVSIACLRVGMIQVRSLRNSSSSHRYTACSSTAFSAK